MVAAAKRVSVALVRRGRLCFGRGGKKLAVPVLFFLKIVCGELELCGWWLCCEDSRFSFWRGVLQLSFVCGR